MSNSDSHFLRDYHNSVSMTVTDTFGEDQAQDIYDIAGDSAIDLLSAAGLGPSDHDQINGQVDDDLQTLIQLVYMRSPEVRDLVNELLDERRNRS